MILSTISISRLNVVFNLKLKSNISIEIKHLIQTSIETYAKYYKPLMQKSKSNKFHHHWAQQVLLYIIIQSAFTPLSVKYLLYKLQYNECSVVTTQKIQYLMDYTLFTGSHFICAYQNFNQTSTSFSPSSRVLMLVATKLPPLSLQAHEFVCS